MIGYKGLDKNLKCRDKQYEVGKTYTEEKAELCECGMHFCTFPLDVFGFYPPAFNRFCEIEADDVTNEAENTDSKRVCKKLTVKAEIGLPGLIKAGVEYIKKQVDWDNAKESNTGNRSAATNTGDWSAATNTGDWSAATNTGYMSAATNTGYMSAATNTGNRSAASVSGKESVACALGIGSKAKGSLGCWLVLSEWSKDGDDNLYHRKGVKAFFVDGEHIKPDVFYILRDGNAVEVAESDGEPC